MTFGAVGADWAGLVALRLLAKTAANCDMHAILLNAGRGLKFTFTRRRLHSKQPWRDLRCGRLSAICQARPMVIMRGEMEGEMTGTTSSQSEKRKKKRQKIPVGRRQATGFARSMGLTKANPVDQTMKRLVDVKHLLVAVLRVYVVFRD